MSNRWLTISNLVLAIAAMAASTSVLSLYSELKIDIELLKFAGLTLLGALFAIAYSVLILRILKRSRERRKPSVYLSYVKGDVEFIQNISEYLTLNDIKVIDPIAESRVGYNLGDEVIRLIKSADYVVCYISKATENEVENIELEIASKNGILILPILAPAAALPKVLDQIVAAELSSGFEVAMNKVVKLIQDRRPKTLLDETFEALRKTIA